MPVTKRPPLRYDGQVLTTPGSEPYPAGTCATGQVVDARFWDRDFREWISSPATSIDDLAWAGERWLFVWRPAGQFGRHIAVLVRLGEEQVVELKRRFVERLRTGIGSKNR